MTGKPVGELRTVAGHKIDLAQLLYHRERFDLSS